jgi:hypothetical protein
MQRARGLFAELEKRFNLIKDDRRSLLLESLKTSRSGTMESETAERVYDLLGPDLLTKFGTGERADRDMLTICEAFQAASAPEVKSLEDLFNEGFANNESVILAVVRAGDGKALRALATAFGGEEEKAKLDRENLCQVINGGGLGDNPAVLIDLLTFGVKDAEDKNVKRMENNNKLKSLGNKFGAEKDAPRLKTLLDDCGLATRPSTNRPGAFAEILLNDGCSVEDLYDFAGKLEQEDKVNLKALMKHGGFGEHPGPLTPLVKDNKLDVLKDIGNAFQEPSDRSNLKKIMDNGGLSGDTSRPGKEHEHTDTLNQVYKDGLEGSAENLLTFTKAFSLVPGQCKMMLDAWNEYPESKKIHREPGKQIAKVLQRMGGDNIDQQIAKLQSQFTSKIDTQVRPSHKAKAIRFAPDLATESAPHDMEKPEDLPESYNLMGNYLCRRHVPKYFSKSDVKDENTMWPPGTDSAKLTEYLQAAISEGGLPTDRNDTRHPDIGGGKEVELGAVPDQFQVDKFALNHFHAGHGWPDTADPKEVVKFTRSDLLGMCAAVGV